MTLTRRGFLTLAGATCAASRLSAGAPMAFWRGTALGAAAQVVLSGITGNQALPLFRAIEAELSRIEGLFSLFRADSALSRLNREGVLPAPDPEFLALLSLAREMYHATEGAFDPSVQPLFAVHARAAASGRAAWPHEIAAAQALVGFDLVEMDERSVRLRRPGMALTLNGIAQGYATDSLARLLRREGLRDVMVNAGEIRATGRLNGQGWPVRLPSGRSLTLTDRAVATSDASGTLISGPLGVGHIFAPDGGTVLRSGPISALHDSAAVADAASTAAVVLPDDRLHLLDRLGVDFLRA
ncbi:FAD:protein FMN transferase [Ponticoccus gilvus]|nr:FAD:protein FMN transferase [Enemella evansiae]